MSTSITFAGLRQGGSLSLKEFGISKPLQHNHTLARSIAPCGRCERVLTTGVRVALVPLKEEGGKRQYICATCVLRGKEVNTPDGIRIVERVKDGDASPFPVLTIDCRQWKDEEVRPISRTQVLN